MRLRVRARQCSVREGREFVARRESVDVQFARARTSAYCECRRVYESFLRVRVRALMCVVSMCVRCPPPVACVWSMPVSSMSRLSIGDLQGCAVPAAKESGQDEGGIAKVQGAVPAAKARAGGFAKVQGCRVCGARGQGAYGRLVGGLDEGQAAGHGEGKQKASTCLGKLSRVRT